MHIFYFKKTIILIFQNNKLAEVKLSKNQTQEVKFLFSNDHNLQKLSKIEIKDFALYSDHQQ